MECTWTCALNHTATSGHASRVCLAATGSWSGMPLQCVSDEVAHQWSASNSELAQPIAVSTALDPYSNLLVDGLTVCTTMHTRGARACVAVFQ